MNVEQIMNRDAKVCHPGDSLNEAAQVMWEKDVGYAAVVDQQSKPIGFLTDRDICMAAYTQGKPLNELRVADAMAKKVICCKATDDLESAAQLMRQNHTRRLPATGSDGILVGILSLEDLAFEAAKTLRGGVNDEFRNLMLEVVLSINHGRLRVRPHASSEM